MIIKKFVAESMNEALARVKQELGDDAVILQSRKVEKDGLLNFIGKSGVEVTAATPDRNPPPPRKSEQNLKQNQKDMLRKSIEPKHNMPLGTRRYSENSSLKKAVEPEKDFEIRAMREEIRSLKGSIKELSDSLKYKNAPSLPPALKEVWSKLIENGMTEKLAHDIVQMLNSQLSGKELDNEELLESSLNDLLAARYRTSELASSRKSAKKPYVISLIGPTGVGKTTTLAKMATNESIFRNNRVALISTDTYRVAAVEQLKTFAGIAGIPMEVVYRPEELPVAISKHEDKDIILIDTAGRSQSDIEALSELKEFMDEGQPDEIVLVLSASTRLEDQKDIIDQFSITPATSVIVTKLDEIANGGHLLELANLIQKSWVYLTTGQNVPDDIVAVDRVMLAAITTKKEYFSQLRDSKFILPDF
jgi:flagellar biosynthesis protein FlhF